MKRTGFSLVELLTVIVIVGILTSIVFAVIGDTLTNARTQATKATIAQINAVISQRAEAIQKFSPDALAGQFKYNYDEPFSANTPATIPLEVAKLVVKKDLFRRSFPQRLADISGYDGIPGNADDDKLLVLWNRKLAQINPVDGQPYSTRHTPETENSELLYLFLTEGTFASGAEQDLDRINPNHIADTDGDGLKEFVDDWGNQLRFYNWTTRLFRPGGETSTPPSTPITNADISASLYSQTAAMLIKAIDPPAPTLAAGFYGHPLNQDLDDFTNVMYLAQENTGILRSPFRLSYFRGGVRRLDAMGNVINFIRTDTCPPYTEETFHTLDTYSRPLIVSAGADRDPGLVEPTGLDPLTGTIDAKRRLAEPLGFRDSSWLNSLTDNVSSGTITLR